LTRTALERTSLTAYFVFNFVIPPEQATTYPDFPRTHIYNKSTKRWRTRKQGSAVGRMFFVHPSSGELYFLRLLLNTVKGPKSFEELRTINDHVHPTFKAACIALGLHRDDCEWDNCLQEAASAHTGCQLRSLFATILFFCEPVNPELFWDKH